MISIPSSGPLVWTCSGPFSQEHAADIILAPFNRKAEGWWGGMIHQHRRISHSKKYIHPETCTTIFREGTPLTNLKCPHRARVFFTFERTWHLYVREHCIIRNGRRSFPGACFGTLDRPSRIGTEEVEKSSKHGKLPWHVFCCPCPDVFKFVPISIILYFCLGKGREHSIFARTCSHSTWTLRNDAQCKTIWLLLSLMCLRWRSMFGEFVRNPTFLGVLHRLFTENTRWIRKRLNVLWTIKQRTLNRHMKPDTFVLYDKILKWSFRSLATSGLSETHIDNSGVCVIMFFLIGLWSPGLWGLRAACLPPHLRFLQSF